jgi:Protein of unknown function (DUF3450)
LNSARLLLKCYFFWGFSLSVLPYVTSGYCLKITVGKDLNVADCCFYNAPRFSLDLIFTELNSEQLFSLVVRLQMIFKASTQVGGNMKKQRMKAVALSTVLTAGAMFAGTSRADQSLDAVLAVGQSKIAEAQKSQTRINKLQDETDALISKFSQVSKTIDGLKVYNAQLEKQLESQREIMAKLDDSISQISVIQRQIQPLVIEMLDGAEQLVELDMPYRKEARLARLKDLREKMDDADITIAEKFRQVLEIYSIEAEYARKIDTYEDTLTIDGQPLTVDIMAVGRIALMYQTADGSRTGAWDRTANQWVDLDAGQYKKAVRNAIRIAQKKAQMDPMLLPISAPEAAK